VQLCWSGRKRWQCVSCPHQSLDSFRHCLHLCIKLALPHTSHHLGTAPPTGGQTEEARAEALHLLGSVANLATPKNGDVMIAATQVGKCGLNCMGPIRVCQG
jgi:hypothetical protein